MAASANHLLCTLATMPSTTIVPDAVNGLKKPVRRLRGDVVDPEHCGTTRRLHGKL